MRIRHVEPQKTHHFSVFSRLPVHAAVVGRVPTRDLSGSRDVPDEIFGHSQYPGVIKHGQRKSQCNIQRVDDFRKVAQLKYDPMFTGRFYYIGNQTWDALLDI